VGFLQFSDNWRGPGGSTVYLYDLSTAPPTKSVALVTPYVPVASDGTKLAPECVSKFTFAPNLDLYFIGLCYSDTDHTLPPCIPAIFRASYQNNTNYPIGFESLKFDPVYTASAKDNYMCCVRVREMSTTTGTTYRIYFSMIDSNDHGAVYYLDDSNVPGQGPNPVLYYTVDLHQIPSLGCCNDGTSESDYDCYHWAGDFAFNDSGPVSDSSQGILYLSNGNCNGACIYKVTGAGSDASHSNFGTPQRLFNPASIGICFSSGIMGMQYAKDADAIYFASELVICKVDLTGDTGSPPKVSVVTGISDPLKPSFPDVSYTDAWISPKSGPVPKPHISVDQKRLRISVYNQIPHLEEGFKLPSPEPNERTVVAQKWIQQMVNKAVSQFGLTLNLSQWSYKQHKIGAVDQVLGTATDQYGYSHAYDVRISRDGKIQLDRSMVR